MNENESIVLLLNEINLICILFLVMLNDFIMDIIKCCIFGQLILFEEFIIKLRFSFRGFVVKGKRKIEIYMMESLCSKGFFVYWYNCLIFLYYFNF